ncbi:MAG: DNA polymerase III subunit epsilon [Gammaproteobacteria bacterium]|nr:DNA polymerase III subunit epsilon [Gammaproteobacteria bacterium]
MNKKLIVLDTETTGLEVDQGHRVVDIGAIVLKDRKKTNEYFQSYLNPERLIDTEAQEIHGISNEQLEKEPKFSEIAESFLEFVQDSVLIIHNAPFDLGFLNSELQRASSNYPRLEEICEIEDTLVLARKKFPGRRNRLDDLADRYEIEGYDRTFHGALVDANILADVYIHLTGGQIMLNFSSSNSKTSNQLNDEKESNNLLDYSITQVTVSNEEMIAHKKKEDELRNKL